jgi:hypothetical protein
MAKDESRVHSPAFLFETSRHRVVKIITTRKLFSGNIFHRVAVSSSRFRIYGSAAMSASKPGTPAAPRYV